MDEILNALLTAFKGAGISAVRRFPAGVMPRLTGCVAAVSVEKVRAAGCGLGEYLGTEDVPGMGLVERYGKTMQATLLIRVYCPDGCDDEGVLDVLLAQPGGVLVTDILAGQPEFHPETDCFVTDIRADVTAYLMALRAPDDDTELLDFRLEGDMK